MKKILTYISVHRFFLPFLLVALVLWYISRLGYEYTTTITLEVEIVPDFQGQVWIEQNSLEFEATVKGEGREILLNQLSLRGGLSVLTSELTFNKIANTSLYTIEASSMQKAIQLQSPALSILDLHDIPQVNISPLESKTLPIKSNIDLSCESQFMVLGDLMLSIDSIEIKAPKIILDTLFEIQTQHITLEDLNSSVSGIARLLLPDYAIAKAQNVQYKASVVGYTEIEMTLPIEVKNKPSDMALALAVPKVTTLRMKLPLINTGTLSRPSAYIDFDYRSALFNTTKIYPIAIDSLPENSQIISITPSYTTPLFEKIN
ncbi:MAG: hypothetical protein R3Y19_05595 [Rikenellaceae bacterium]